MTVKPLVNIDHHEIGRIVADYGLIQRLDIDKMEVTLRLSFDQGQDLWELLHQLQMAPGGMFVDPRD